MTLSEWLTRLAVGSDRKTTITNFWFIGEPTVVRGNGRINQLGRIAFSRVRVPPSSDPISRE